MKTYTRKCRGCKNIIEYKQYKMFWKSEKTNSQCRPCFYKSLKNKPRSKNTKKKIGEANKLSLLGNIPWNKGIPMTEKQKHKLSIAHTGKKCSKESVTKRRINALQRWVDLGIPTNRDRGAAEFFVKFNKKENTSLKPKMFWSLGYEADGYDDSLNLWVEFDPPHHYYVDGKQKPADIIRQNNIIEYFENIGNPLTKFIRVKSDKMGNVLKINTVYEGVSK